MPKPRSAIVGVTSEGVIGIFAAGKGVTCGAATGVGLTSGAATGVGVIGIFAAGEGVTGGAATGEGVTSIFAAPVTVGWAGAATVAMAAGTAMAKPPRIRAPTHNNDFRLRTAAPRIGLPSGLDGVFALYMRAGPPWVVLSSVTPITATPPAAPPRTPQRRRSKKLCG